MDPMQAATSSQQLKGDLGVWIQPGLGQGYPALKQVLADLRKNLVGKLAWVPVSWSAQVNSVQDANPTDLVRLTPSKNFSGVNLPGLPSWIADSQQHIDAWQEIVTAQDKAIVQYAANDAAAGKPILDALYAKAAFYNSAPIVALSNVQEALIAAPSAVSNAAGTFVSDLFGGFLKKSWWVIGLAVVGYILWTNRQSVAKSAGKRIGKAIA